MAAAAQPRGSVPEKHGTTQDVNPSKEASALDEQHATETEETVQAAKEETSVDESDLKALEAERKVPYQRFKEMNEKAKQAQANLQELEGKYKEDLRRVLLENETLRAVKDQRAETSFLDIPDPAQEAVRPVLEELKSVRDELNALRGQGLQSQLEKLKAEYPDADEMAALGIKKHNPKADLREVMEMLHNRVSEKAESKLKAIIEQKKLKAKQGVSLTETGFKLSIKDKPKTVKEASALFKKYLAG